MAHDIRNFDSLIGRLEGFSEKQLKVHFTLYQGYVKKLNEIEEKLTKADRVLANYSFGEYSELKRREAVPLNGTVLHELYFENLSAPQGGPSGDIVKFLQRDFGSIEAWLADLKACGSSTPGWVLLTWSEVDQKLHHYILFEHHIGLPAQQCVLLAMDCWEHAFMIDYGIAKADYLNAFIKNINWKVVNERLEKKS